MKAIIAPIGLCFKEGRSTGAPFTGKYHQNKLVMLVIFVQQF